MPAAQKSNRGAPGYARWVNRPLGRQLAALAFKAGRTPDQVTLVSAVCTFSAIVLIALIRPTIWLSVMLFALLTLGFALDAADGQLARLRGGGSSTGEWLDHIVDCIKSATIHLSLVICWFRFFGLTHPVLLLIPLVFSAQASIFFFAIMLTEQLRRAARGVTSSSRPQTDEHAPALRSILVLPADYGILCVLFLLLSFHRWFVIIYAALLIANIAVLLGALPKWFREMRALG